MNRLFCLIEKSLSKGCIVFLLSVLCFGMLLTARPVQGHCNNAIAIRGVVEGFYGTPWTHQQRLALFDFMRKKGMNAYMYAPKDDEYHRKLWRQEYPDDQREQLKSLVKRAKARKIDFIFAISPGNDIDFSGSNRDSDRQAMLKKLQVMYDMGVRSFALLFDDIPSKDAAGQAEFANWLNQGFIKNHRGCKQLILVPTEYFLKDMEEKGEEKEYTHTLAQTLDKDIMVLHTGEEVCPDGLKAETMDRVNQIYGRVTGLWWNYPVNDYIKRSLGLGPIDAIDKKLGNQDIGAFLINPMEKAVLSKIAISTGADFSLDPAGYKPEEAWERALQEQFGEAADDMKLFAQHSQRLQNNWAHIGRQDAPQLQADYKKLWEAAYKQDASATKYLSDRLLQANKERVAAIQRLERNLPQSVLAECTNQLKLLMVMSEAEELALKILGNQQDAAQVAYLYAEFTDKLLEVEAAERSALLSQKTLRQFTVDFVKWYQIRYGRC